MSRPGKVHVEKAPGVSWCGRPTNGLASVGRGDTTFCWEECELVCGACKRASAYAAETPEQRREQSGNRRKRPLDPPKAGKVERIALHPDALAALERQRARLQALGVWRPDGPVFPILVGKRRGEWRRMYACIDPPVFARLVAAAGLANPHAWDVHSLRHSGATLESAAGADPRDTMRRTRHADLDQLQQYTHGARELPASRIPMLPKESSK